MNKTWSKFWMRISVIRPLKKFATRLATWGVPPQKGRVELAYLTRRGYVSPLATIHHDQLTMGDNVFIDDRVEIFKFTSGSIYLGERVCIYRDTIIETGSDGVLRIGNNSSVHPRCQINAYAETISIGSDVMIAANCALYPYNHGIESNIPIIKQPLQSRGGITIKDGAWLGFGVIVLSGVTIGEGAVISAGSLVTNDVPDEGIAAGVPAKVVNMRPSTK